MDFRKLKELFLKEKEKEEEKIGSSKPRSGVDSDAISDALKTDFVMKSLEQDEKLQELEKGIIPSGATVDRPSEPSVGQSFFDTDLGKAIIYNGSAWVNFDGSVL